MTVITLPATMTEKLASNHYIPDKKVKKPFQK